MTPSWHLHPKDEAALRRIWEQVVREIPKVGVGESLSPKIIRDGRRGLVLASMVKGWTPSDEAA